MAGNNPAGLSLEQAASTIEFYSSELWKETWFPWKDWPSWFQKLVLLGYERNNSQRMQVWRYAWLNGLSPELCSQMMLRVWAEPIVDAQGRVVWRDWVITDDAKVRQALQLQGQSGDPGRVHQLFTDYWDIALGRVVKKTELELNWARM